MSLVNPADVLARPAPGDSVHSINASPAEASSPGRAPIVPSWDKESIANIDTMVCIRGPLASRPKANLRFSEEWEYEDELPRWEDLPGLPSANLHENLDGDNGRPTSTSHAPATQDHETPRRSHETTLPTPPDSSLPSGPDDCENEAATNHSDQQDDIMDLVDNVIDHINTMTEQGFSTSTSANVTENDKQNVDYFCNTSGDDSDCENSSAHAATPSLMGQPDQQHLVPNSNTSANKRKSEDSSQVPTPASTPPGGQVEGHETKSIPPKRRRTLPYTHDCCTQGFPCEHPLYRMSPGNRKLETKVFRHQRFSLEGLASDNQVRFIMRWSDCVFAEQCHDAWSAMRSRELREEDG